MPVKSTTSIELDKRPETLVNVSFCGLPARSTGVVNLLLLLGLRGYHLVERQVERSRTREGDDGHVGQESTRYHPCEKYAGHDGCFLVREGGDYWVARDVGSDPANRHLPTRSSSSVEGDGEAQRVKHHGEVAQTDPPSSPPSSALPEPMQRASKAHGERSRKRMKEQSEAQMEEAGETAEKEAERALKRHHKEKKKEKHKKGNDEAEEAEPHPLLHSPSLPANVAAADADADADVDADVDVVAVASSAEPAVSAPQMMKKEEEEERESEEARQRRDKRERKAREAAHRLAKAQEELAEATVGEEEVVLSPEQHHTERASAPSEPESAVPTVAAAETTAMHPFQDILLSDEAGADGVCAQSEKDDENPLIDVFAQDEDRKKSCSASLGKAHGAAAGELQPSHPQQPAEPTRVVVAPREKRRRLPSPTTSSSDADEADRPPTPRSSPPPAREARREVERVATEGQTRPRSHDTSPRASSATDGIPVTPPVQPQQQQQPYKPREPRSSGAVSPKGEPLRRGENRSSPQQQQQSPRITAYSNSKGHYSNNSSSNSPYPFAPVTPPLESPALGFTPVMNSLAEEFSLEPSEASSYTGSDYLYDD